MAYGVINVEQMTTQSGYTLGAGNASSFKNRIINGAMVIDQRNAGASVTNTAAGVYTLDRWRMFGDQASKFSIQQNAGGVTPPTGYINYLGATSLSAYAVGAAEIFNIAQRIEGFNVADLGWGTASAQSVTMSFWVRSSLTGTFGGALRNSAGDRSYPFSYSISAANTWEQKSITIAGDTTGTWLTTNGIGILVNFSLGTGTTYSGTAGAWAASNLFSATGATSVVGTNGATLYITGVQLEVGTVATSFDYRSIGQELLLCQRYFYQITRETQYQRIGYALGQTNQAVPTIVHPVKMRAAPSAVTYQSAADFVFEKGDSGASYTLSTLTLAQSTTYSLQLSGNMAGSGGGLGVVWYNANANAYLGVSAEL